MLRFQCLTRLLWKRANKGTKACYQSDWLTFGTKELQDRPMHPTVQKSEGMLKNNRVALMDEGAKDKELFIIGSHFNKLSIKQIDHKKNKDCNFLKHSIHENH